MTDIIDSDFAILDVKKFRSRLRRRVGAGDRVPVVIRGYIVDVHSRDDGISQEFAVEVTNATEET